jgi:hypothetical protein
MRTIILIMLSATIAIAQPTKEQVDNAKKIEALRKDNKGGKNSKKIIELLKTNAKIEKEQQKILDKNIEFKKIDIVEPKTKKK